LSSGDPDVVVIGAGPNGLFAAARLARAGLSVLVLEALDRPGGALWTVQSTLPGFLHDVGAGFVAFHDSPAFQGTRLSERGLSFVTSDYESAHPAPDGTCAAVSRDLERGAATFGPDAPRWRELFALHARQDQALVALLGTIPQVAPLWRIGVRDGLALLAACATSSGSFARRNFSTEAARRVFPAMGLHVDVGPDDAFGMPLCWMLTMRATTAGFAVPVGGAASITRALLQDLEAHGGRIELSAPVERIVVQRGRAVGVSLQGGRRVDVRHGVLADTTAASLYLELLEPAQVPSYVTRAMRRFPQGWGTFKLDLALSGPVPWLAEPARRSSVVHVGDSVDDLARFTAQVRDGQLPDRPYLVVGQHTLCDPSRAPAGQHTLYLYTHAPSSPDTHRYPGGWPVWRERLADQIIARIEELAPGFSALVLQRAIQDPSDLQARASRNVVGGDLGGGSNAWHRQFVFRPVFPYFRYRTPVRNVLLCSSYAHPGAGIHGMCGWNAAGIALEGGW
jgi:phytoene dehydrogenase-like protein